MIYTAQQFADHLTRRGATVVIRNADTRPEVEAVCGGRSATAVFNGPDGRLSREDTVNGDGTPLRSLRAVVDALNLPYIEVSFEVTDKDEQAWRNAYTIPTPLYRRGMTEVDADEYAIDWRSIPAPALPVAA